MNRLAKLAVLFALGLATGWAYGVTLTNVAISPKGAAWVIGGSQQFTVVCTYSDNSTDNCTVAGGATWSVSHSSTYMTVSSAGLATWVSFYTDPLGHNPGFSEGWVIVTAGGMSDKAGTFGQRSTDTYYLYPTPDYRNYKLAWSTGALLPLNIVVGSTVAIGQGAVLNNATPGATTGSPFEDACNWSSSNTSVATVNRIGDVTGVAPGTVTITCGLVGNAVYGTSAASTYTPPWQSPGNFVNLTIVAGGTGTTTWYVRPLGGTPYTNSTATPAGQCDGKHDADYPGTGVNQPCAMGNLRFLWTDEVTNQLHQWMIAGGDTVIVRQNASGYNTGLDSTWGGGTYTPINCSGDYNDCVMPSIPSGTSAQHTRILGENYASCHADSAKTLLHETWGANAAFNIIDSQFVDIACFEVTDVSQCTQQTSYLNSCANGVATNVGRNGIESSALAASDNVTDIFIHGIGMDGFYGPVGVGVVLNYVHIRGTADAGINMDDGAWNSSNISVAGGLTLNNSITEFAGCVEEYPIAHTYPLIECRDQNTGGYGDGFGTASTSGTWSFNNDIWRYNFQDGLDLLHSGMQSLTVTNSNSYGNDGNQYKIGSALNDIFQNNYIGGNCQRIIQPIGDEPISAATTVATNVPTYSSSSLAISFSAGVMVAAAGQETTTATIGNSWTLAASSTTYVWIDPTTFTISFNTTGFPGGTTPQYQFATITTNTTGVTSYQANTGSLPVTYCRAGGAGVIFSFDGIGAVLTQNNTNVGYGAVPYELDCANGWEFCSTTLTTFQNNILLGYTNPNYNGGQAPGNPFYEDFATMPANSGWSTRTNNSYQGLRYAGGCPGIALTTNEVCVDPLFVSEPPLTLTNETNLDNYNFNLSGSSIIKAAGIAVAGLTTDQVGVAYQNPPSMGALQYAATTILGNWKMQGIAGSAFVLH